MDREPFFELKSSPPRTNRLKYCCIGSGACIVLVGIVWAILAANADPCPLHVKAVNVLNTTAYVGTWHEMYRVKGASGETGNCTTAKYNITTGGVGVYNMDWFGQKPN